MNLIFLHQPLAQISHALHLSLKQGGNVHLIRYEADGNGWRCVIWVSEIILAPVWVFESFADGRKSSNSLNTLGNYPTGRRNITK